MPEPALKATRPVKRSFTIDGHRTSISLEAAYWDLLKEAARREGVSLAKLAGRIDRMRGDAGLSGAVRVWVLGYVMRHPDVAAAIIGPAGYPPASGAGPRSAPEESS